MLNVEKKDIMHLNFVWCSSKNILRDTIKDGNDHDWLTSYVKTNIKNIINKIKNKIPLFSTAPPEKLGSSFLPCGLFCQSCCAVPLVAQHPLVVSILLNAVQLDLLAAFNPAGLLFSLKLAHHFASDPSSLCGPFPMVVFPVLFCWFRAFLEWSRPWTFSLLQLHRLLW